MRGGLAGQGPRGGMGGIDGKLIAGTNITLDPANGVGNVTISSSETPYEVVAVDPRAGAGLDRECGTIVVLASGAAAWVKVGTLSNAWIPWARYRSVINGSASPATTLTLTLQDGDADRAIDFFGHVVNATGADILLRLRPNGATTNLRTEQLIANGGTVAAGASAVWDVLTVRANKDGFFWGRILARTLTGAKRHFIAWGQSDQVANPLLQYSTGDWDEAVTNITSLDLVASGADSMAQYSWFFAAPAPVVVGI